MAVVVTASSRLPRELGIAPGRGEVLLGARELRVRFAAR
jgi:hypothetical protein